MVSFKPLQKCNGFFIYLYIMNTAQEIYDYFNKDYSLAESFIKVKFCAIERIPILRELKHIHQLN